MSLPETLPFTLPGNTSAGGFTAVDDHADAAVSRLTEQYRDKPLLAAFARIVGKRAQLIEDQIWKLYQERWVETAVGAQLDLLGRVVGQARQSFDDDQYRLLIKARIKLNKSSGTIPEILEIFRLITPAGTGLEFLERYPAGFRLQLNNVGVGPTQVALFIYFLKAARAGGVRGALHWITTSEEDTFGFFGGGGTGFGDSTDPDTGGRLAGIAG